MATKWKDLKHKATPEAREKAKTEALIEYANVERNRRLVIHVARRQTLAAAVQRTIAPQADVP